MVGFDRHFTGDRPLEGGVVVLQHDTSLRVSLKVPPYPQKPLGVASPRCRVVGLQGGYGVPDIYPSERQSPVESSS